MDCLTSVPEPHRGRPGYENGHPQAQQRPRRILLRPCGGTAWAGLFVGLAPWPASAYKFSMNVEEAIVDVTPTLFTVASAIITLTACGGSQLAWCRYLDTRPSFEQVRGWMLTILGAVTLYELGLCLCCDMHVWTCPVVLVATVWGPLDAVLRFPAAHDLDSVFALKQIFLLVIKVVAFTFGFVDIHENKVSLFTALLINVIELPLIYFLALPLEEEEAIAPAGRVVDVDILLRLFQIVGHDQERREFAIACRRRFRDITVWCARSFPMAEEVLLRMQPSLEKTMRKSADL